MIDFLSYEGKISTLTRNELQQLFHYLEHYQMSYRYDLNFSKDIPFGIEIEFGKLKVIELQQKLQDIFEDWSIHHDPSTVEYIGGYFVGGEVTSPKLYNTKETWMMLELILEELKALGGVATDKTAFHVHVDSHLFHDEAELIRLVKVWCIFEDIIFRFGYGEEETYRPFIEKFAPPISPIYLKCGKLEHLKIDREGIRYALNLKKCYLYDFLKPNNTIEFRNCNGTLNPIIAQNIVNFFIKLVEYVTSKRYDEKLIDSLFYHKCNRYFDVLEQSRKINLDQSLLLSDLLFEEPIDKLNFLKQYIKDDLTLKRDYHL